MSIACLMKRYTPIIFIALFVGFSACFSEQTVYIFETGEKYHKADCQYLGKSKISIKYEDALKEEYEPCEKCKPIGYKPPAKTTVKRDVAVQCSGTTQAGTRCKNKTKNASGKCYSHERL